jgi:murein L,D-transpeptidase YafK
MGGSLLTAILLVAPGPRTFPEARLRIEAAARAAGVVLPLPSPELRVQKKQHQVELWAAGRLIARYPAGLGHRGLADKAKQGDHLTPEGSYRICTRNERSAFHLFLGISYPGPEAAERGLRERRISPVEHRAILRAEQRQGCPPWNTSLGGSVGLHGGGSGSDWTWGCIALENGAIEELWEACPLGTPVRIER